MGWIRFGIFRHFFRYPRNCGLVNHVVLAFVHRHHDDDQHVILHPIDQAIALFIEFDFVVPSERPVQRSARDVRVVQPFFE